MHSQTDLRKVAFLGDYPPRRCGIATFTADLRNATAARFPDLQCPVVAISERADGYAYPPEVRFEIPEQDLESYRRAADFLNFANMDVLCVQHEYGVYGGPCGSHLLALLRELRMPVVTTLHTILRDPSPEQRRVMAELVRLSTRVVVMAAKGVEFLQTIYQVPDSKIELIPHGIPDVPFVDPDYYKDRFGVEGRNVLLTFGLLSPNKGIEHVLQALPRIAAAHPDVVYIVLGATHPHLVREQGEAYRLGLELLAKKLGVETHVVFMNRFVESEELAEFLGAADVYITPYLNEAQITSGTLAYSVGVGKAVVSTPYWHATELLADGRGVLVPFAAPDAIADAVIGLFEDEGARLAMRRSAYRLGREMTWTHVAYRYAEVFGRAREARAATRVARARARTLDQRVQNLPPLRLDHLVRMTDQVGLFQHAVFTIPEYSHGYCTDDNARGLLLTTMLEEMSEEVPERRGLASSYAAFLHHAFDRGRGRFRNFMGFDRRWLEETGSEDSHGRALWALGTCVGRSRGQSRRAWALDLFELGLEPVLEFTSPRAWAFTIIGIHEYLRALSGDRLANRVRDELTARLMDLFHRVAGPDWPWLEEIVAYDNAKIPHALILTGRWTNQDAVFRQGLDSLAWLADHQTASEGHFRPVGSNGFWRRGAEPARFDQQPLEAHAMVSACLEAFRSTNDRVWFTRARRAFEWFLGANDLGGSVYDATSGGCRDGLHPDRANQNQGAESTLAFLLSLLEIQGMQNALSAFENQTDLAT